MSRYPYTEAYDALRIIPEKSEDGISVKLSRSDTAQIVKYIAESIGMEDELLACKIADHAAKENKS